jgi:hypothetical protein
MVSSSREARLMNLISTLLLVGVAAAPLAVLGAWIAGRREPRLGSLVHVGGSDGWWRQAMPWPQGVQEDDDVHWNFGPAEGPKEPDAVNVDPVRVRPAVRRGVGR